MEYVNDDLLNALHKIRVTCIHQGVSIDKLYKEDKCKEAFRACIKYGRSGIDTLCLSLENKPEWLSFLHEIRDFLPRHCEEIMNIGIDHRMV